MLFADIDGAALSPISVTRMVRLCKRVRGAGPHFSCLRHTHASQFIDAGVDIVTISKRLGHAKPAVTLRIYAHLFRKDDGKAAAAINAIREMKENKPGPLAFHFLAQSGGNRVPIGANFAICSFEDIS